MRGRIGTVILTALLISAAAAMVAPRTTTASDGSPGGKVLVSQVLEDIRVKNVSAPEEDTSFSLVVYSSGAPGRLDTVSLTSNGTPLLRGIRTKILTERFGIKIAAIGPREGYPGPIESTPGVGDEAVLAPEWMESQFWYSGFNDEGIKQTGVSLPFATFVTADGEGKIWFKTKTGSDWTLCKFDPVTETVTYWEDLKVDEVFPDDDGNVWFKAKMGNDWNIGRFNPDTGEMTYWSINVSNIVPGNGGSVWFTNGNSLGRIDSAGNVSILDNAGATSGTIAADGTGAVWYADKNSGGALTRLDPNAADPAFAITRFGQISVSIEPVFDGAGNVWVADSSSGNTVTRIDDNGTVHSYAGVSASAFMLADGQDKVWFENGATGDLSNINSAGNLNTWEGHSISNATTDNLGNFWFRSGTDLTRIAADGSVTTWTEPKVSTTGTIALGVDPAGNVWFRDQNADILSVYSPYKDPRQ